MCALVSQNIFKLTKNGHRRCLLLALLVLKKREIAKNAVDPRKHKVWVRKLLTERNWKGEYHVLVKEMMLFDHETFYKQFRMSPSRYE